MFKNRLTKENFIKLIPFFPKNFTLTILQMLLQRITRSKSNRCTLFYSKIIIRQISFIRNFGKFREVKLIRFTSKFSNNFLLFAIYNSSTSIRKGLPKIIGQDLLAAEPSTKKSAGYLILPHRTSTSRTIPIGEVSLLAR